MASHSKSDQYNFSQTPISYENPACCGKSDQYNYSQIPISYQTNTKISIKSELTRYILVKNFLTKTFNVMCVNNNNKLKKRNKLISDLIYSEIEKPKIQIMGNEPKTFKNIEYKDLMYESKIDKFVNYIMLLFWCCNVKKIFN